MGKLKNHLILKKVSKLLNTAPRPEENYTHDAPAMFIGAQNPRTASHFANGTVALRQTQVKETVQRVLEVIEALKGEAGRESVVLTLGELDVRFEEMEMELLLTDSERAGKAAEAGGRRVSMCKEAVAARGTGSDGNMKPSKAELEEMQLQVLRWQKEQGEQKRKLYKIETTVRDLGLNVHDLRCRGLESERRAALATLQASTAQMVTRLKGVVRRLEEIAAGVAC